MGSQRAYRTHNYAFGNQILLLRTRAALTQIALARQLGVHRRSVQNWETGVSYPKAETLQRLIALFVHHQAFMPGNERVEAQALWDQAADDSPTTLVAFDEVWFARLIAANAASPSERRKPDGDDDRRTVGTARIDLGILNADEIPSRGLPLSATSFVGRNAELIQLAHILRDPACRLLTLLGPGGIGKTRLAIEIATQADEFADGVVFVSLASVGSTNQIASAISDALHVPVAGQADPTHLLLSALRDRQLLLVLDNFEHLLDGAELIGTILEQAPAVIIVTTSRERLNLQAEWLFDVDGLAYPAEEQHRPVAQDNLTELLDYSAIELFVQRARQVRPALPLTASTLTTIARICQHVAGMPLAIELAAAGVRTLSLSEIERQISAHLFVLSTTLRDVPPRHRSLRAVFDHSWALLREAERILLSRLAVFRGGFTAAAAERVAEATTPTLLALVEKSLLRPERGETWSSSEHGTPEPRFGMLEPIREYALERLEASPDAETVHVRHGHYYALLAETALAEWDTPRINEAIARQRREHDNMRAALQWACDTGNSALGLRLATALWGFWRSYGYGGEGRAWLQRVLQLDPRPVDHAAMSARRRGLHAAAWLASDQHDYAIAAQLFQESMQLREALGETDGDLDLLINAAREARAAGHYQRATALLEDSLSRYRRRDNAADGPSTGSEPSPPELGQVLRELALVLRERGDFSGASSLLNEGLALHRAVGDRVSTALAQLCLGDVARDQGDVAAVYANCEPSLAVFRELGMQWAIGFALNNLALAAGLEGQVTRAGALADESVALFRGLEADASVGEVLITVGQIAHARGDRAAAAAALVEALRLALAVGPRILVAAGMEALACVLAVPGQLEQAVRLLGAASALRVEMGTPVRPADQPGLDAALATAQALLGAANVDAMWAVAATEPLERILSPLVGAAAFDRPPPM